MSAPILHPELNPERPSKTSLAKTFSRLQQSGGTIGGSESAEVYTLSSRLDTIYLHRRRFRNLPV